MFIKILKPFFAILKLILKLKKKILLIKSNLLVTLKLVKIYYILKKREKTFFVTSVNTLMVLQSNIFLETALKVLMLDFWVIS